MTWREKILWILKIWCLKMWRCRHRREYWSTKPLPPHTPITLQTGKHPSVLHQKSNISHTHWSASLQGEPTNNKQTNISINICSFQTVSQTARTDPSWRLNTYWQTHTRTRTHYEGPTIHLRNYQLSVSQARALTRAQQSSAWHVM